MKHAALREYENTIIVQQNFKAFSLIECSTYVEGRCVECFYFL